MKKVVILLSFLFVHYIFAISIKCKFCGFVNRDQALCKSCYSPIKSNNKSNKLNKANNINKKNTKKNISKIDPYFYDKITDIGYEGKSLSIKKYAIDDAITIFDFYADWCGSCKTLTPLLERMTQRYQNVYLRKINIQKWKSPIANRYKLKSIPSVWIFNKDKKLVAKKLSTFEEIEKKIKDLTKTFINVRPVASSLE